jgi:hypothetical protein
METVVLALFALSMVTLAGGLWRLQHEVVSMTSTPHRAPGGPNRADSRRVQQVAASEYC